MKQKHYKLLGNRVALLAVTAAKRSSGGIAFPANYQNPAVSQQFRVLNTGPGKRLRSGVIVPPEVGPGDFVLLAGVYDHQVYDNGVRIVDASEIVAKWRAD